MLNQLGWAEVVVLAVAAIFIFGPERLPRLAADAGRTVRKARTLLAGVQEDLRADLGPEIADLDLRSLRPRTLVQRMLDDPSPGAAPVASPGASLHTQPFGSVPGHHLTTAPQTTPPQTSPPQTSPPQTRT